jgi:hypothetical protein
MVAGNRLLTNVILVLVRRFSCESAGHAHLLLSQYHRKSQRDSWSRHSKRATMK